MLIRCYKEKLIIKLEFVRFNLPNVTQVLQFLSKDQGYVEFIFNGEKANTIKIDNPSKYINSLILQNWTIKDQDLDYEMFKEEIRRQQRTCKQCNKKIKTYPLTDKNDDPICVPCYSLSQSVLLAYSEVIA